MRSLSLENGPNVAHRMEILFVLLFANVRRLKSAKLQQVANSTVETAKRAMPTVAK